MNVFLMVAGLLSASWWVFLIIAVLLWFGA